MRLYISWNKEVAGALALTLYKVLISWWITFAPKLLSTSYAPV